MTRLSIGMSRKYSFFKEIQMMSKLATCFCLILFLIAMPSLLVAQQASVDMPNTVSSATCGTANNRNVPPAATLPTGPRLGLLIKALDAGGVALPNVKVNPPAVALAGCQLG